MQPEGRVHREINGMKPRLIIIDEIADWKPGIWMSCPPAFWWASAEDRDRSIRAIYARLEPHGA